MIGAPFYVMEKVDGWAPNLRDEKIHNEPPFDEMPYEYGIPFAIVDGLIALANVDYKAIGLEGLRQARATSSSARSIAGRASSTSYKERYGYEGRHLDRLCRDRARGCATNVPDNQGLGIIHGDVGTPEHDVPPWPARRGWRR